MKASPDSTPSTDRVMVSNAEPKIPTVDMGVVDSAPRKKKRAKVRWSSFSYTTRMTLAFACIAAMTALVAIGVVSFVWEQHFQTYTADNMETLADTTANRIADNYEHTGDLWNPDTTKPAAQATEMTSGVGVKVIDAQGGVPYDSSITAGKASRRTRRRSRWPTSSSTERRSDPFISGYTGPTRSCASPIRSFAITLIRLCSSRPSSR